LNQVVIANTLSCTNSDLS